MKSLLKVAKLLLHSSAYSFNFKLKKKCSSMINFNDFLLAAAMSLKLSVASGLCPLVAISTISSLNFTLSRLFEGGILF